MATVEMIMDNLIAAMQNATSGLSPSITYFKDLPSAQQLSNLSRPDGNSTGNALCYVFDLDMSRDTTRWPSFNVAETLTQCGTSSVLSSNILDAEDTVTLTLEPYIQGGTVDVTEGDYTASVSFTQNAPYIVLLQPSWESQVWVSAQSSTGFTAAFSLSAPAGATCDYLIVPTSQANTAFQPVIDGSFSSSITTSAALSGLQAIITPNWNSNGYQVATISNNIVLGWSNPASPADTNAGFGYSLFPVGNNAGSIPVTSGAYDTTITLPIAQSESFVAFVLPSWNTQTAVSKTDTALSVLFSTPAPAGASLGWVIFQTTGGSPNVGDGVSFVTSLGMNTNFSTAFAVTGDTFTTLAARLAAAINNNSQLNLLVSATSAGTVITITNLTDTDYAVYSQTANGGSITTVVGNRCRSMLITLQTRLYQDRDTLSQPILGRLHQLQTQGNIVAQQYLQLEDTTWMRVRINNDRYGRADHLTNTYRYDATLDIEYSVTIQDILYPILATVPVYSVA